LLQSVLSNASACPAKAGVHIEAEGIIPVSEKDVAGIPDIALYIPDFEGQAILRIFSNSTEAEIGCFAAQITNGNSFRQKTEVGSILGAFTLVAVLSSFATTIYGEDVIEMRKHYTHSVSVMVVFAVWHYIYFSGAMSVNWPNVLVSFWSNYAWTGGMVYSEHMQNLINDFIGSNKGNTSQVGAAGTGVNTPDLGGGYDVHEIYKRAVDVPTNGFSYYGQPVKPGLPLPGNFSGFAGTLAQERIPASNAFMTCLLWSLTAVVVIIASIGTLKISLEVLTTTKLIKSNRLVLFRSHYIRYVGLAVLRAAFIGFFMLAFASMFQFAYLKSPSPVAVACAVFLVVVFGIGTAAGLACYCRVNGGKYVCERDDLVVEKSRTCRIIPWFKLARDSDGPRSEDIVYVGSIPWWRIQPSLEEKSVHDDEKFIQSFGWLVARYRHIRWWFFAVWLVYEFVRACFLAGASSQPLVQVFGLLAVEFVMFLSSIYLRPFEGQRLNILLVYLLGFSKMTTTALSATFDTRFNLPRIPATVIGIVIIIIQGLLTITVLITIVSGAITTYFSITRHRKEIRPRSWIPRREKYFQRISPELNDLSTDDVSQPPSAHAKRMQEAHNVPCFSVKQVKRVPKVEDEDEEFVQEICSDDTTSGLTISGKVRPGADEQSLRSQAASDPSQFSYMALPRAAIVHRPSWSSQDFAHHKSAGRARTLSNAATPKSKTGGGEDIDGQLDMCDVDMSRSTTPTSSPVLPPGTGDDSPNRSRKLEGGLSLRSRASSRPVLEPSIPEEEVLTMPQNHNSEMLYNMKETKR
jgi:hypothetical protein